MPDVRTLLLHGDQDLRTTPVETDDLARQLPHSTVVNVPQDRDGPDGINGAEIVSHDYRLFPLDALWCDDAMREPALVRALHPHRRSRSRFVS